MSEFQDPGPGDRLSKVFKTAKISFKKYDPKLCHASISMTISSPDGHVVGHLCCGRRLRLIEMAFAGEHSSGCFAATEELPKHGKQE
jgi:hypothetical protein